MQSEVVCDFHFRLTFKKNEAYMHLSFPVGSDQLEYTEAGGTRKQEEIP